MQPLALLVVLLLISSVSSDFFPVSATQSGDLFSPSGTAANAVDNNPSTCSLAAESNADHRTADTFGWLQVDLGNPFLVSSISLTNALKNSDSQYLQNFVILVSQSNSTDVQSSNVCLRYNDAVAAGTTMTFTCTPKALIGRYITIKRQGGDRQDAISICDIHVTHDPSDGFIYLYNLPTSQIGAWDFQWANRSVDLDVQTCAQPVAAEGASGWWSIDLNKNYLITDIIIFKENTVSPYSKEFEVWIGSDTDVNSRSLCYNFTGSVPNGGNVTLTCHQPSVGRLVNITRWGSDNRKSLVICEIYIKGQLSDGSFTSTSTVSTTLSSTSVSAPGSSTPTSTSLSTSSSATIISSSKTSLEGSHGLSSPTSASSSVTAITESTREAVNSSAGLTGSNEVNQIAIICPVVIIGGLIILAAVGVFLFCYFRKRQKKLPKEISKNEMNKLDFKEELISTYRPDKPKPPEKPKKPSPQQLPIKTNELIDYVERIKYGDSLKEEFKKLPEENLDLVKAGKLSKNSSKNRFKNILPYDHTIVSLAKNDSDKHSANYINANYITGYKNVEKMYIATQGPKLETLDDFWRMVWQENVELIIMTTLLHEQGKKKVEQYWPTAINEKKSFGSISVQLMREEVYANHVYREMELHGESNEIRLQRTVRHIQYLMWEDKQKPKDFLPVLAFRKKVRELQQTSALPIVVHCSAGVGRTGTYIALDTLLEQLKHENQVSFFRCVEELRNQRMNMVQTWKQYAFLHEAVADHLQTGDTSIPRDTFAVKYKELLRKTPNGSKLEQQFELLNKLRDFSTDKESAGNELENISKNRNKDIVAYDDSRPYLDVGHSESDYINAIYVEGRRSKEAFVLTQLPLKETIVDFWRLIWDNKFKVLVLLEDSESTEEDCPKFFPDDGATEKYGPFSVEAISVSEKLPSVRLREFSLKNASQPKVGAVSFRQYQVQNWASHSPVPSSPSIHLPLIKKLLTTSSKGASKSIVFQCKDGTLRSGLMAAMMYVADMIEDDDTIDIFYACRIVALNRPQIINSMEQYSFLHEFALTFMEMKTPDNVLSDSSTYANCQETAKNTTNEGEYQNCRNSFI